MGTRALTKDLIKRLSTALTKTPVVEVAVGAIGLPKSTYYHWKSLAQEISDSNPDRENLCPSDELLLEFLDSIEVSRAKLGQKISDAAIKGAMTDPRVAIDILQRMFPEQFSQPVRREVVIRQEGLQTGTGIALIPSMGSDNDLDQMLQQQQSEAHLLAKTKTNELS